MCPWRCVAGKGFLICLRVVPEFFLGSFQSGQMGLTVNQLAQPSGVRIPHCPPETCPCGAAVAHSLGKTGVMGSIPITGSLFTYAVMSSSFRPTAQTKSRRITLKSIAAVIATSRRFNKLFLK
jgi:hypothetical protein